MTPPHYLRTSPHCRSSSSKRSTFGHIWRLTGRTITSVKQTTTRKTSLASCIYASSKMPKGFLVHRKVMCKTIPWRPNSLPLKPDQSGGPQTEHQLQPLNLSKKSNSNDIFNNTNAAAATLVLPTPTIQSLAEGATVLPPSQPVVTATITTNGVANSCNRISDDPINCSVCGKKFSLQRLLNRHVKCHSEVKRYSCAYCCKGFNDTFDPKRHIRTHTGVRPYECSHCEESFTQRCSLESHSLKVHGLAHEFAYKERRPKVSFARVFPARNWISE